MSTVREDLDEENWDVRETFAYFGRAFYMASVLEVGLVHVLLWGDFMMQVRDKLVATKGKDFNRKQYEADFDAFVDRHFAQTMGNVLRRLHTFPYLDENIRKRIQAATARRDFLADQYWRERSEEFATREGRLKMRNELEEDTGAFRQLDRDIEAATKPVRAKLGINDDIMDEYVRVSLEKIKGGLPWD